MKMVERIEEYVDKRTTQTAQLNININERPDSLDIGTPSKGGNAKIYFNAEKPEEAKKLIESIIKLRVFAQQEMEKAIGQQVSGQ